MATLYSRLAQRKESVPLQEVIAVNWEDLSAENTRYAEQLVGYIDDRQSEMRVRIDAKLKGNWSVDRLARVDLCLIMLGLAEFEASPDVSPAITFSEVLALANKYSEHNAPKFVHGVLAALLPETAKSHWDDSQQSYEISEEEPVEESMGAEEILHPGEADADLDLNSNPWVIRVDENA